MIFFAVVLLMLAAVVGFLTLFANGMSDAPSSEGMSYWPTIILFLLGVLFIVLHILLRGHAVHW